MGTWRPATVVVAVLLVAVTSGSGRKDPVPTGDVTPVLAANVASAQYTPQEFYEDYAVAVDVVNKFWVNHWGDFFTGSYSPPRLVSGTRYPPGMYDGTTDRIVCGPNVVGDSHFLSSDNAEYCGPPGTPGSDFVGYDMNFLWKAHDDGDMFVYMIVAHEWGHAVQARLNSDLHFVAYELQADCLAGAALQGAGNDGTLQFDSTDAQEVVTGLTDIADEGPWGKPGDHGDPQQRIDNFMVGVNQGPMGCVNR